MSTISRLERAVKLRQPIMFDHFEATELLDSIHLMQDEIKFLEEKYDDLNREELRRVKANVGNILHTLLDQAERK